MKQVKLSLRKTAYPSTFLASILLAALCGVFGVLFLVNPGWVETIILSVIILLSVVNGISLSLKLYSEKQKIPAVLCLLAYLGVGALVYLLSSHLTFSVVRIYGLWLIISGIVRGTLCAQAVLRKLDGIVRHGLSGALSILFGLACLLNPVQSIEPLTLVIGVYLLIQAFFACWDGAMELLDRKEADQIKRRVRIPLPLIVTAFIPIRLLNHFNKYFELHDPPRALNQTVGDLEVFIHVVNDGPSTFGHVDICYKGLIYSYGVYDHHSNRLFGLISDGAMAVVERQPYLDYSLDVAKKLMAGFTIDLTAEQSAIIERQLKEFFSVLTPWQCDAQRAEQGILPPGEYTDPASELYKATGARIYKVTGGKFKTYYAFSTNCVALADFLIGPSGLDIKGINGILTPGTYYSLLDAMYRRKNSIVTRKTIYKTVPIR